MVSPRDLDQIVASRLGTTLMGKYRLDSVLGYGGMAAVYAATHRNSKRVAVKILHQELRANSSARLHFQREGYAANRVAHRGVVRVDDDDVTDDGTFFIVMELLEGMRVEQLRKNHGGRLPLDAAVSIGEQLLDVLRAAHDKNVIHRDIKPANLFLLSDGSLKVLDFGIARIRDETQSAEAQTTMGGFFGTPGFMAPEQAAGRSHLVDGRTDLWAVAATLFHLLTGEFVHSAQSAQELVICSARDAPRPLETLLPDLPPALARVVNRGLAFDKTQRWPSAREMRDALLRAHREAFDRAPEPVTESRWWPACSDAGGAMVPTSSLSSAPAGESLPNPLVRRITSGANATRLWRRDLGLTLVAVVSIGGAAWGLKRVALPMPLRGALTGAMAGPILEPVGPRELGPLEVIPRAVPPAPTLDDAGTGPSPTPPSSAALHGPRQPPAPIGRTPTPPAPAPRAPDLPVDACLVPTTMDDAGIKHPKAGCYE
jgi:serine/threonine-protein kinase